MELPPPILWVWIPIRLLIPRIGSESIPTIAIILGHHSPPPSHLPIPYGATHPDPVGERCACPWFGRSPNVSDCVHSPSGAPPPPSPYGATHRLARSGEIPTYLLPGKPPTFPLPVRRDPPGRPQWRNPTPSVAWQAAHAPPSPYGATHWVAPSGETQPYLLPGTPSPTHPRTARPSGSPQRQTANLSVAWHTYHQNHPRTPFPFA